MEQVEYHLLHRYRGRWGELGWWRPLVGLIVGVVAMLAVQIGLVVVFAVFFVLSGADVTESIKQLSDTSNVTPSLLAYLNLSLAAAIPVTILVTLLFHQMRPGWLCSVVGRMRWQWLGVCFLLSVAALGATVLVGSLIPVEGGLTGSTEGPNEWTSTMRDFVIVIVLLTPLQAAGEEFAFRGYLTQAFGGLFASFGARMARVCAVLLPAVLFALAHGAQDAPVFVDRLAFGIVSGVLVIATGGLEAGIAMHVLNNFLAYGLALAFTDMTSALNPSGGSWWSLPTTLTQSLVYLVLAVWAARSLGIARTTGPGNGPSVLAGPESRV